MTSLDAVAAAIRERLLAGQPAPLLGLGTLVRQHVAARVEERADGTRVMLPPGETIGLDPTARAEPSLSLPFARRMALSPDVGDRFYAEAIDQIEARLAATGEVRLPGVGLLRRTSGGVVLGVEAELLAAVNRRYEGLDPVPAARLPVTEPPPDVGAEDAGHERAGSETGDSGSTDDSAPDIRSESPTEDSANEVTPDADEMAAEGSDGAEAGTSDVPDAVETPDPEPLRPLRDLDSAGAAIPFVAPVRDEADDGDAWAPPDPHWMPPAVEVVTPTEDVEADTPEEALAAPFGSPDGPALADVLPPTPDDRQPPPDRPSEPSEPDDAWTEETWTAPGFALDAPPEGLPDTDALDDQIEDADFDVVAPRADLADPAPLAASEPGVADMGSFLPPPASVPPASPASTGATSEPGADTPPPRGVEAAARANRRWVWWAMAALLLALVAAAVWLWTEAGPRSEPGPGETITVEAPPTTTAPPLASRADDPALIDSGLANTRLRTFDLPEDDAGGDGGSTRVPRSPGGAAPSPPPGGAAAPRPGRTSTAGVAVLPPRVSGLTPADVRALAGRDEPITPRTDAWTLVVLSTSSRTRADATYDLYRRAGYRTAVLTSRSGQLRVAVGQYPSREDAVRLLDRLPPQAPADTWPLDLQTL